MNFFASIELHSNWDDRNTDDFPRLLKQLLRIQ